MRTFGECTRSIFTFSVLFPVGGPLNLSRSDLARAWLKMAEMGIINSSDIARPYINTAPWWKNVFHASARVRWAIFSNRRCSFWSPLPQRFSDYCRDLAAAELYTKRNYSVSCNQPSLRADSELVTVLGQHALSEYSQYTVDKFYSQPLNYQKGWSN